jgi:hypothetical protein
MLLRRVLIYTLICTLLLCPYPCLAKGADNCRETHGKSSDCKNQDGCCPKTSSETQNNKSDDSNSNNQGGTCLCHGAILGHVKAPINADMESASTFSPHLLPILNQPFAVGIDFLKECKTCHFPSVKSGIEVRALIESLLL